MQLNKTTRYKTTIQALMACTNIPSTFLLILFLFPLLIPPTESSILRRAMTATPSSTNSQFLAAHNAVRSRHKLPSLQWSAGLARYAKWYANKRRRDCALVHSDSDYGENIFWGQGNRWKAGDAVAAWAAQEAYYDYKSNSCMAKRECLHYTQVVWRKTVKVGCAKIKCASGDAYVVCEYYPHGNVIGERPY